MQTEEEEMTQDEINQMVEQAGFHGMLSIGVVMDSKQLEAFAKLVAAKAFQNGYEKGIAAFNEAVELEREACAEIAEKQRYAMFISLTSHPAQNGTAVGIANAIRARGNA